MKLAFLILAHKNASQLARLIAALRSPGRSFHVHIDRRQPDVRAETHALLGASSDVHFVEPARACRWGTYSIVEATLLGLRAVRASGVRPQRLVLISGQDYPVVSNEVIDDFFARHAAAQFIEAFALDAPNRWSQHAGPFQALARVERVHLSVRGRWLHLPLRQAPPHRLQPHGGSQWWALTGECVEGLLQTLDERPEIERYFRRTFIPDELIFQTLVMNSRWRDRVDPRSLRFVDFTRGHPTPPAVLGIEDLDLIRRQPDVLFARKFDTARDSAVLDRIDAWRTSARAA